MESPGTQAFSIKEALALFHPFAAATIRPVHTSWDTKWFGPVGKLGGNNMGWFLLCDAVKE
jgi:hypothetical protein